LLCSFLLWCSLVSPAGGALAGHQAAAAGGSAQGLACAARWRGAAEAATRSGRRRPQAYRRWSLEHPSDFALIFGTPLPGYHAPQEVTAAAAGRSIRIAADVFAAAVQAGAADPGRAQVPADLKTEALWGALLGGSAPACEPVLAGIVLSAWASLLGYLVAEIFGSLTQLISDTGQLYQAHIAAVMLGLGFQPALIEAPPAGDG
jgi:hypothetical protein